MAQATVALNIRVREELYVAIQQLRGNLSATAWIARAIEEAIEREKSGK